ncbi:MAG TPA: molybdopterin-binding protein, partial [Humibacter sp.]|nr:molybdopterin-binding protein [Humibacter sp.]
RAVRDAAVGGARLIVTTGGTGLGPRDVTPEATAPLLRIALPGIAERIRAAGSVPTAALSRGVAGIVGDALLINLAGSPGAVRDGIPVVLDVAEHALSQLDGRDHR